jgi:hypothetical protein
VYELSKKSWLVERHVSRYQVEQAARNSEVLHTLRSEVRAASGRIDTLGADVAGVKATLIMHGRALDVMQDMRQVRGDVNDLRSHVNDLRGEVSDSRQEMRQELTAVRQEAASATLK